MEPDTIVVNGFKGLVGDDGLSLSPVKELVDLGYLQPDAGTPANPLRVEGKLLAGEQHQTIRSRFYQTHLSPPHKLTHEDGMLYHEPWQAASVCIYGAQHHSWWFFTRAYLAVADADAQGRVNETWVPLLMTVPRFFKAHIQPAWTSAGPGRYETSAGKYDRTV